MKIIISLGVSIIVIGLILYYLVYTWTNEFKITKNLFLGRYNYNIEQARGKWKFKKWHYCNNGFWIGNTFKYFDINPPCGFSNGEEANKKLKEIIEIVESNDTIKGYKL